MIPPEHVLVLSVLLLVLGGLGALLRRSAIVVLLCIELMWNAGVLALAAFARQWADPAGHVLALVALAAAGAGVAVGVAILAALWRERGTLDAEDASVLRW